uniref:Uncharacterized protein n=1 Tax=Oryza punctata TaxID=4537 RepID=A0A0E0LB36_ORYPU
MGKIGPKKPICARLFHGVDVPKPSLIPSEHHVETVVTKVGDRCCYRYSQDTSSWSPESPRSQHRFHVLDVRTPTGYGRLHAKNRWLKDVVAKGQVELEELKTDLASLRHGLCVKLLRL